MTPGKLRAAERKFEHKMKHYESNKRVMTNIKNLKLIMS